jgi:hypothetical protein
MLPSKASSPLAIGIVTEQHQHPNQHHTRHRPLVHHNGDENHTNTNIKNNKNNSNSNNINSNNINSNIEIEIEWKETKCSKEVRFDPTMDWKTERIKSETGHLRRLAEREIRKRLELEKQQLQLQQLMLQRNYGKCDHLEVWHRTELVERWLSRSDRQKEAFLYICFCDVDLLVRQYNNNNNNNSDKSDTVVLARLFDKLFEDAGIKTLSERKKAQSNNSNSNSNTTTTNITTSSSTTNTTDATKNENDSWLWVSFFALQIEYRRIYDGGKTTMIRCRSGTSSNSPRTNQQQQQQQQQQQSFVSGLSRNADQVLFFIHWLSPAFRFEEKESKQHQVHSSIVGDNDRDATARLRFEDYVFRDRDKEVNEEDEDNLLVDLRFQLHRFFETAFCSLSSLGSRSRSPTPVSRDDIDVDLGVYFATIRSSNDNVVTGGSTSGSVAAVAANDEIDEIGCDWACSSSCEDIQQKHNNKQRRRRFAYELLNSESKHLLFLISAMPAFRAYYYEDNKRLVQQPCEEDNNNNHFSSLLSSSSFLGFSPRSTDGCNSNSNNNNNSNSNSNSNSKTPCASENDPKETSADIHCDNCPLLSHYEYEFTREICNLLFERARE